jgi:flagellar biogenesis protein FliO
MRRLLLPVLPLILAGLAPAIAMAEVQGPPVPAIVQDPAVSQSADAARSSDRNSRADLPSERRALGKPKADAMAMAASPDALRKPGDTGAASMLRSGSWERTMLSLLGVLGLIVLVMRLVRRYSMAQGLAGALGAGGRAPSGVLEVLARYPIARGQSLVLLRLDRRVLLCCHTRGGKFGVGGGMTVLTELTEPEDVAAILVKTRDSASESIARRFQSILSRSEHDTDRVLSHAEASGSTPRRRTTAPEAPRALPRGEAGRAAAYGLDVAVRAPSGADAADAIRRRLAAMRAQGVTA